MKVPQLDIDARFGELNTKQKLDRKTVYRLLSRLERAGFTIISVLDGEDRTKVSTIKDAMELIFNLDESWVFVRKEGFVKHWIYLVMGNNEPCDMIADWSYLDDDPDSFNVVMGKFLDSLE